jgi:hypothetical protein
MSLDFWEEVIGEAADIGGFSLTPEQIKALAEGAMGAHENYGMAFYSPPASDGYARIEREWEAKYKRLEAEFERYRNGAETAIKRALPGRTYHDSLVSIEENGDVRLIDGRMDRIL